MLNLFLTCFPERRLSLVISRWLSTHVLGDSVMHDHAQHAAGHRRRRAIPEIRLHATKSIWASVDVVLGLAACAIAIQTA